MPLRVSMFDVRPCSEHYFPRNRKSSSSLSSLRKKFVFPVPWKLGMARHSLACSCPSVCRGCKFQTVLRVYIPDDIHALGLPSSKNTRGMNTTFSYSAKVFDSPFGRNMHNTIQDCYFHMQGILVTAESPLVSMHPTRSVPPVSVSQMKTVLEHISDFRA